MTDTTPVPARRGERLERVVAPENFREAMRTERRTLLERLYGMTRRDRRAHKIAVRIRELDIALGEPWQLDLRRRYPRMD